MTNKLDVSLWALSINAEGLWAIGATIAIVAIVVAAVAFGRNSLSRPHEE